MIGNFYSPENLLYIRARLMMQTSGANNKENVRLDLIDYINMMIRFEDIFQPALDKVRCNRENTQSKEDITIKNGRLDTESLLVEAISATLNDADEQQVLIAKVQSYMLNKIVTTYIFPLMEDSKALLLCLEPGVLQNTFSRWLKDSTHPDEFKELICQYKDANRALNDALYLMPNAEERYKTAILGKRESKSNILVNGFLDGDTTLLLSILVDNPKFLLELLANIIIIYRISSLFAEQAYKLVEELEIEISKKQLVVSDRGTYQYSKYRSQTGSDISHKTTLYKNRCLNMKHDTRVLAEKTHQDIRDSAATSSVMVPWFSSRYPCTPSKEAQSKSDTLAKKRSLSFTQSDLTDTQVQLTEPDKALFKKVARTQGQPKKLEYQKRSASVNKRK